MTGGRRKSIIVHNAQLSALHSTQDINYRPRRHFYAGVLSYGKVFCPLTLITLLQVIRFRNIQLQNFDNATGGPV